LTERAKIGFGRKGGAGEFGDAPFKNVDRFK